MAFNLPLPRVVADTGPGGGIPTAMNALNVLENQRYQNQLAQSNAQYAPYTNYANALSKTAYANMLPYQIQAQVLSNPMLAYMYQSNPQGFQDLLNNFAKSMPNINNNGTQNIPLPEQIGTQYGGLFGALLNKLGITWNQQQNAMNTPSSQPAMNGQPNIFSGGNPPGEFGNGHVATDAEVQAKTDQATNSLNGNPSVPNVITPLVPASGGIAPGIIGTQSSKFTGEPHKNGETFVDTQGKLTSSPTDTTRTNAQTAISAAKRVEPQLKELADAFSLFMTIWGKAKNIAGIGWNLATGELDPSKLPTQHARAMSLLTSAPESLLKTYGLNPTDENIKRMQKVIEPTSGETKTQYHDRILQTLEDIKNDQVAVAQGQLTQGFPLNQTKQNLPTPNTLPKDNEWLYSPEGWKIPVHKTKIDYAINQLHFTRQPQTKKGKK